MRVKLVFSKNSVELPKDNLHILKSYVHKCLGENNQYHDKFSDYSISHIAGGVFDKTKKTFNFPNGAYIVVSSPNFDFINEFIKGVLSNVDALGYGLKFLKFEFLQEKFLDGWNHFATLSPFILQSNKENKRNFFVIKSKMFFSEEIKEKYNILELNSVQFKEKLQESLIQKLKKYDHNLDLSNFEVLIKDNPNHKGVLIPLKRLSQNKTVMNPANICHVSIKTNKKVAEVLYNLGFGKSTGSGFGTIYKTENHKVYHN